MRSKVIFGNPKWPPAAILWKTNKKRVAYWYKIARNAIASDFRLSKMAARRHFKKYILKKSFVLIWNGENHMQVNTKLLQFVRVERTDWTTVHLKCLDSIRYPLIEYNTSTKILTDCRHYPGASKWPGCKPFGYATCIQIRFYLKIIYQLTCTKNIR